MATQATKENGQQLAKFDANSVCTVPQMRKLFDDAIPQLQAALPQQLRKNADKMARCAITEFQKNPELAKCTGLSILSCAIQAAQLGLEIGGVMGQTYMVPYGGKATFQIGYRGMIALAFRSGYVANLYASIVREKDKFRILRGTSPGIEHEPRPTNAGNIIGAYAVVVYKSKEINFEYMNRPELEHHRDTYSKGAKRSDSPWATAFGEMAKKTVLRKLLKQCPFAADFPQAAMNDEEEVSLTVNAVSEQAIADTDDGINEPRLFGSETDISAQAK